ncbi:DUF4253 domain-containing protein [Rhodopirellula europaea]|uniref:DUF4253 domain-containing protein n=1 Tax=Rhodopirellula europaea SH398 TaxID=1263868 RepID=M5S6Y8_9BACT|nr:DUF4253 domain-containing protein [Rhodopirellula europaea]EMI27260.1 hypothetical protein RESH_02175 [Rhodopirellula europaea SH398]
MIDEAKLKAEQTNGANYDVTNDDVIARLKEWDAKYGVQTSDIDPASVTVHFDSVPDDTTALAAEIYKFCPDTVSQGFGCYVEMIDAAEEMEEELDPKISDLIEGVDLDDENYGLVLLAKALKRDKVVGLWWD